MKQGMPKATLPDGTTVSWKTGDPTKQDRMEVYLEWLLTPKEQRHPATKRELAEHLDISSQTLRNYAKDPWLQRELIQRGRAINRVERAQDVLDALYTQAIDPDNRNSVAAAKAWLDWINRMVEPSLATDVADMSDEELLELVHGLVSSKS